MAPRKRSNRAKMAANPVEIAQRIQNPNGFSSQLTGGQNEPRAPLPVVNTELVVGHVTLKLGRKVAHCFGLTLRLRLRKAGQRRSRAPEPDPKRDSPGGG